MTEFIEGETGFSTLEKRWARPALDVNGILGGFTGDGAQNRDSAKAMAKFTMRLVLYQDPQKIFNVTQAYLEQLAPATAKICVTGDVGGGAYLTPLDHPIMPFIAKALQQAITGNLCLQNWRHDWRVEHLFRNAAPSDRHGQRQPNRATTLTLERTSAEELFYQGAEAAAYPAA